MNGPMVNDTLELQIESLSGNGAGIARTEAGVIVFVAGAAEGDVVRARIKKVAKNYIMAQTEEVIAPGCSRIPCECSAAERCGGCAFSHVAYEYEVKYKRRYIEDCLKRIGRLDVSLARFYEAKKLTGYRNKAVYRVGSTPEGEMVFGFCEENSNCVVGQDRCLLCPPEYAEICRDIVRFCSEHGIAAYDKTTGRGELQSIYIRSAQNGDVFLGLATARGVLKNKMSEDAFCEYIAKKHKIISVCIRRGDVDGKRKAGEWRRLFGGSHLNESLCGKMFRISPSAFFQVNHDQTEILYREAGRLADVREGQTLLDLYCGTGTIGICLAKPQCRLVGVEISPDAAADAAYNARSNGARGEFISLDAGEALDSERIRAIRPDVVILDPPRKGCGLKEVRMICGLRAPRIVYISCNPATLSRDLAEFTQNGYAVCEVLGVDMFPRTGHVETVCLMSKVKEK